MRARVIEAIRTVAADRHKLVILLGDFGAGKTSILKDVASELGGVYINLNLHLTDDSSFSGRGHRYQLIFSKSRFHLFKPFRIGRSGSVNHQESDNELFAPWLHR